MIKVKLLLLLVFIYILKSGSYKKTGIQLSVRKYTYTNGLPLPCKELNKTLCRLRIVLKADGVHNRTYLTICHSALNEAETTFIPPTFKEFIYNEQEKLNSLTDLLYTTVPMINGNLDLHQEKYVDTLLYSYISTYFEINCNPCVGAVNSLINGYVRIKYFPMKIDTNIKHLSSFAISIGFIERCHQIKKKCIGLVTNGGCPGLESRNTKQTLIVGDKLPPYDLHPFARIRNLREMLIIYLSVHNIEHLSHEINKIGLGIHNNDKYFGCVDDVIWVNNFNKNPYDLYIIPNSTGVNGQFYGFTAFFVGSYKYGGINSRYKCDVKQNFKKCIDSSIVSCGDKFKAGNDCQEDISICKTNPCKNFGKCHGLSTNYYCSCKSNSYGKNCEKFTCNRPCNKSICTGPNICNQCLHGYSGTDCKEISCDKYKKCNMGVCEIKNGVRLCECLKSRFTGSICQHECIQSCNNGICSFTSGITMCVCLPGYFGITCDRKQAINPIIIQKSLYFDQSVICYALIGAVIIIIIFLLMIFIIPTSQSSIMENSDQIVSTMIHQQENLIQVNGQTNFTQMFNGISLKNDNYPSLFEDKSADMYDSMYDGIDKINNPVYEAIDYYSSEIELPKKSNHSVRESESSTSSEYNEKRNKKLAE